MISSRRELRNAPAAIPAPRAAVRFEVGVKRRLQIARAVTVKRRILLTSEVAVSDRRRCIRSPWYVQRVSAPADWRRSDYRTSSPLCGNWASSGSAFDHPSQPICCRKSVCPRDASFHVGGDALVDGSHAALWYEGNQTGLP